MAATAVCPICGGTGWKIIERGGLTGAARCRCAEEAMATALKDDSGIPPNSARASLDNFQIPQDNPIARKGLGTVLMQVRSFVREFPTPERPGLLLVGGTGTGKTHLAVAALKALIDKGHQGLFLDYQRLLERIRSSYDITSGISDRDAYRSALEVDVLLLDELGAHRMSDWVEDTITAIVTYRANNRKPLIATTNLPDENINGKIVAYEGPGKTPVYAKSLTDVIGARARSRLFEMCRVIDMPAVDDYRVKHGR
jgi:DNA replication protein DnaC